MGYRTLKNGTWAKPVGFTILVIKPKKKRLSIAQYFHVAKTEQLLVWTSAELDGSDLAESIADFEANKARFNFYSNGKPFNFADIGEILSTEL